MTTDDRPVAELVREHLANRDRYAAWRYAGNEPWSGPVPVAPPVPYDNRAWDWLRALLAERDALTDERAVDLIELRSARAQRDSAIEDRDALRARWEALKAWAEERYMDKEYRGLFQDKMRSLESGEKEQP